MIAKVSVGVIGLGYVGLPILHLLSKKKIKCFGFDINEDKLNKIKKNISYVSDLKNSDLKIIDKKNIFSMQELQSIEKIDYLIFCLPTPLYRNYKPDMSLIKSAFELTKPYLKKNQTIVLESTVYPGATKEIFYNYLSRKFILGKNFYLCYCSERISPGQSNKKEFKFFLENTTKVISGYSNACLVKINFLYKKIFKHLFLSKSIEIAEMSKLVENSYRSVNIGLVNELKTICSKLGLNIHEVLRTAASKPFGFNVFKPGPGVGGHCIPIDPVFIDWVAKKKNIRAKFINLARETNIKISSWVLNKIYDFDKKIRNKKFKKKILIIGMAYKENINDTRESPSIKIFKELTKNKNKVEYHDSLINSLYINKKKYESISISKIKDYDYVIICTAHKNLNKKKIIKDSKIIFDSRGALNKYNSDKIIQV